MDTWLCAFLLHVALQYTNVPDPTPGDTKGGRTPQGLTYYVPSTPVPTRNTVASADNVDWSFTSSLQTTSFCMYWTSFGGSTSTDLLLSKVSSAVSFRCVRKERELTYIFHSNRCVLLKTRTHLFLVISFYIYKQYVCLPPSVNYLLHNRGATCFGPSQAPLSGDKHNTYLFLCTVLFAWWETLGGAETCGTPVV